MKLRDIPHFTVTSSHGVISVSKKTGDVLSVSHYKGADSLYHIKRFDLDEYQQTYKTEVPDTVDILDIGYWTHSDKYEPACQDWRAEVKILREGGEL